MTALRIDTSRPFWRNVSIAGDGECWEWTGPRDRDGYGRVRTHAASRVALVLATGKNPGRLHALHSCDNPGCCNPRHLRWGTHTENMQDKMRRGRWRGPADQSGAANGAAKLTDAEFAEIVRRLRCGHNNIECAVGMPIGHSMVSKIRVGKMWREQSAALGWTPTPMFKRRKSA